MPFSLSPSVPVNETLIKERVQAILSSQELIPLQAKQLRLMLEVMDLTSLNANDSIESIQALCQLALHPSPTVPSLPQVAAVCIYPPFIPTAKNALRHSAIRVATVAGGFPEGNMPSQQKYEQVQEALDLGADEIDMVLNRDWLLQGEYAQLHDEIANIKQLCAAIPLKVILETGALPHLQQVSLASRIAIAAGADFIKTSTGKIPQGASLEAVLVMLDAIQEEYASSGKKIGLKPSGGISTVQKAQNYMALVKHSLGESWLHKDLFRFGASSLLGDVVGQIKALNENDL